MRLQYEKLSENPGQIGTIWKQSGAEF